MIHGNLFLVLVVVFAVGLSNALNAQEQALSKSVPKVVGQKRSPKPKLEKEEMSKLVDKLSDELDDVKKAVRDGAEAKLLEMGSAVIEFLPPVSSDSTPEWKMRIERLREALENLENKEFTLASNVNLTGSMTAREALTEMAEQTGNLLTLGELANLEREVVADFEDTPFWEAFDEVLDQVELTVAGGDGESIQFVPRSQNAPMRIATAGYAGVFRLEPLSVLKTYKLHDPGTSNVRVQVLLSWEPRLTPVFVKFPMESMNLVCDNGETLKAVVTSSETEFVPAGGSQLQVELEFDLPSKEATRIKRWDGKVFVTIPGKPATIEFSDLMNADKKEASVGNLKVVLEKARKNRDIYEVLVGLKMSGKDQSSESFRGWSNTHEAYLLDAKKNQVDNVGWSTTRMTDDEIGLSYLFDIEKGLDGCKFMVKAPANIVDQTIEFTLEDVPLP